MIRPIVTNINELRKPCLPVEPGEDIKELIQDLKDTLEASKGLGISANQIGVQKRVSYISVPGEFDTRTKKFQMTEMVLINPKIISKETPVLFKNEGCTSFHGIRVNTKRFIFIVIEFLNEKGEVSQAMMQDLEAIVVQHEVDHSNGITLFDRKWKAR